MKTSKKIPQPVVLIVLDGWGIAQSSPGNAITLADTPTLDKLWRQFSHSALKASGEAVGLFPGEIGSSEVGHVNLGAGKVVKQSLPRITESIMDRSFFTNKTFQQAIQHVKRNRSRLHLMGLMGCGGVHSCIRHLFALLKLARKHKIKNVYIHGFSDGRDTEPKEASKIFADAEAMIKKMGVGKIVTVSGRYFAMDRDNRWNRTARAYNTLIDADQRRAASTRNAIRDSYKNNTTDEFIEPTIIGQVKENTRVQDNDAVIFFNLRPDRAKQLTQAFVSPQFRKFKRERLKNLFFVTMVEYGVDLPVQIAFPVIYHENCLAGIISRSGLAQLHIAETEKYAHVTYFFDNGHRKPHPNEDWVSIPSPRVPTYDLKPEMSAKKITERTQQEIIKDKYNFVLINFANADMVGHTGKLKPTIRAIEIVDGCLDKIVTTTLSKDGTIIITGDHGNAEEMVNPDKKSISYTSHTINSVPFILIGKNLDLKPTVGKLADVAPTILDLLDIRKPAEMTGQSLLLNK